MGVAGPLERSLNVLRRNRRCFAGFYRTHNISISPGAERIKSARARTPQQKQEAMDSFSDAGYHHWKLGSGGGVQKGSLSGRVGNLNPTVCPSP